MRWLLLIAINVTMCNNPRPLPKITQRTPMPSFKLILMDSVNQLNTDSIHKGKPTVFFLFSPECPFCIALTKEIISEPKLSTIKFYLLSPFPFQEIKAYSKKYHLERYSNITVGHDPQYFFSNHLKVKGVPFLAVYDNDKQLKHTLIGKISINDIRKAVID